MNNKKTIICVGIGVVGLQTAISFIKQGYRVTGVDVDQARVDRVNDKSVWVGSKENREQMVEAVESGRLRAMTKFPSETAECGTYILSVPTPVTEDNEPNFSYLRAAARSINRVLNTGDLVILQSTVPPGACRDVLIPVLERSEYTLGEDFGVAYVPERYSPGDSTTHDSHRIVAGVTKEWQREAADLYRKVADSIVPVESLETAEAAKIVENVQRDVNIALVNEVGRALAIKGIDIWKVISAAETKYNFHRYDPGLGVGGHCIPVDPYQLMNYNLGGESEFSLMSAARKVNEMMPQYHFDLVKKTLESVGKSLESVSVGIFGASYKPGVRDSRNSPVIELAELLQSAGAEVRVYDPEFASKEQIDESDMINSSTLREAVRGGDVLVGSFETINCFDLNRLTQVMRNQPVLLDVQAGLDPDVAEEAGFIYRRFGHRQSLLSERDIDLITEGNND